MQYSDNRDETARSASDHDDLDGLLGHRPPTPTTFQVNKVSSQATLGFIVGDNIVPQTRYATTEYRIYETPYSTVDPPSDISDPVKAFQVFKAGQLVGSISSPGKGGNVVLYDAQYVGKGCWFFAVSVNALGTESLPSPPVENPTHTILGGGGGPGEGNDSDIPADVTGVQVLLQPELVEGRKLVRATVSALIPEPRGSFAGYQIYLQNYEQDNENVTDGQVVEGAWFVSQTDAPGGSPLVGTFRLQPDSPVPYTTGTIAATNGSATLNGEGNPHWDSNWTAPRRLCFYGTANAETSGAIHRYDNEIALTVGTPAGPQIVLNTVSFPWRTQTGLPYVIYLPDHQAIQFTPHPVRMYFVSISRGGTRRPDVLNSPYVEFPFGISLALSKPLNPNSVTALFMGATVQLFWDSPSTVTQFDNTIDRYNIYRVRLGSYLEPNLYAARPSSVYATVTKETIVSFGGKITWVDRQFNNDPTVPATTPVTGWDFDPTNAGVYAYWVTATNVEGTENRSAYWGQMTVTGTALAWNAGDLFSSDYEGKTISNGTDARVVTADSWSAGSPNALTTNTAFPSNGTYPFYVGSVTGAVTLMGNAGAEDDPSIYRDNFHNRLFNTRLYSGCPGNVNLTLTIDHGGAYGPAINVPVNGQPTFKAYFSWYPAGAGLTDPVAETGIRYETGTQGRDAPGGGAATDSWSIWEYLISNGGQVIPYFIASGVANGSSGEIELDPTNAASGADYTVLWQHAAKAKFLFNEDLVMTCYAKTAGTTGTGGIGIFRMQMIRYDSNVYANPPYLPAYPNGIERDDVGGDISCSAIPSDYADPTGRLKAMGRLPHENPVPSNVTLTNASTTVQWTSGTKFRERWVGCTAVLNDGVGNTQNVVIQQVLAGAGTAPDDCEQLVVSAAWGFASHAGTVTITIKFDRYAFKFGLIGQNADKIRIKKLMVNGGRIGAAWIPDMRQDDEPGGDQQTNGGNPDRYDPVTYRCVPRGTVVLTPDGYRAIESLHPGELVVSKLGTRLVNRKILGTTKGRVSRFVDLYSQNGVLTCSTSHRVGVRRKGCVRFIKATQVKLGELLVGELDGLEITRKVDGIAQRDASSLEVHTLTVAGPHNYFAGGILCHNKPAPIPPG